MVRESTSEAVASGSPAATAAAAGGGGGGGGKGGVYTWQEVAQHNTTGDAWISIGGKVYDITSWMNKHPGGFDALHIAAGRDVTQVFRTYHLQKAYDLLPKFEIGTLSNTELVSFPEESKLFYNLKLRVAEHFKQNGGDPKSSPWAWVRYACVWSTVLLCSYLQIRFAHFGVWFGAAVAVVQGFACALLGLMPLHDASHFSITHYPLVWRIVGHTHDFLNGSSFLIWNYQHVLGHHAYTNIDGADPDIDTADVDIRRIKGWQPWLWPYVYQHVYVPVVYALLAWKTRYQDVLILFFTRQNGPIRVNPPTTSHVIVFVAGKLFWAGYRLLLPLYFMPWQWALLYVTISDFTSSYWLALTFQANHVVHGVEWPRPDANGAVDYEWAEMQLKTTQDYAHRSWFWTTFTGALNYQTCHHVLPGVNQVHYPAMAPIVKRTALEFGNIPYLHLETFGEALGSHINYLFTLGQKQEAGKAK